MAYYDDFKFFLNTDISYTPVLNLSLAFLMFKCIIHTKGHCLCLAIANVKQ